MSETDEASGSLLHSHWAELEGFASEQSKGLQPPPPQPVPPSDAVTVPLPPVDPDAGGPPLGRLLAGRRSRRAYSSRGLTADELSFILWAAQGLVKPLANGAGLRTSPSGGARHPLDTYVAVSRVEGIESGLYVYLPDGHSLWLRAPHPGRERLLEVCHGQEFAASAPVLLIWAAVEARTSWRYGPAAPKLVALDAGHACENLYLACEHLGLGTCAIGAYMQAEADGMLGLDGRREMTVYMAPVGRRRD